MRRGARRVRERLASWTRLIREREGYTQEELAERSGVETRVIQRVEAGTRDTSFRTLERVATGLAVDLAELVAPIDPPAKRDSGRPPRKRR
jgi:transcriptional regulator with XRE-family HTH domain